MRVTFPLPCWQTIACQDLWKNKQRSAENIHMQFITWFGVEPSDFDWFWVGLDEVGWLDHPQAVEPVHLMWAFMFLRLYLPEHANASVAGVSVDTFRNHVWDTITGLSLLYWHKVRHHLFFFQLLIHVIRLIVVIGL